MAIDFNGVNNNQVNTNKTAQRERPESPAQQGPQNERNAPAAERTNVSLSDNARNLSAIESALQQQPDVDDSNVERIRQALEDGSFQVDAEKVAQKMLDMDQSIFG